MSKICDKDMTFEECELTILRHAVDESEKAQKIKVASSGEIKSIFEILENFIIKKKTILYGGLALNRLMPKDEQFYNEETDLPDYDMFSENALDDAKELADIYYKAGYTEVEARSGVHHGTFKVFVDFMGIADITQIPKKLFHKLKEDAITIAGMKYCPPNFLRMSMYLELSRPAGDVSRWEKVLKRLTLLNKYYPLTPPFDCEKVDFQRDMETSVENSEKIYYIVRDSFIEQGVVFFGGFASTAYSKHMPDKYKRLLEKTPDFDVLSTDPDKCAMILIEKLHDNGFTKAKSIKHEAIGELIPEHIQINIGIETVAFIFKPIACHSYNTIKMESKEVKIATIDTMLSFYLAFIYIEKFDNAKDRILCMAKFLFDVQQENRLAQKGVLKRFTIDCYGKQPTLEAIRAEKAEKFRELKSKKNTREYEMWFLKYNPAEKLKYKPSKKTSPKKSVKVTAKPKPAVKRTVKRNPKYTTVKKGLTKARFSAFYK